MAGLSVAVVGAGIGGLAAALALAADGHAITLIEKRTGFGETGAGIQLSPNAVEALAALGIAPPRGAVEPAGITIRDIGSGRVLAEMALGASVRERYGAPYLVAARADLHTTLLDAVRGRPGIRILVGRTLVGLSQAAGAVTVTLEGTGGARTEVQFDLVVGADGIGSAVRVASGDKRPIRPSGYVAARAVTSVDALPDGLAAGRTGLWWGRGRHVVHYPVAGGSGLNLVVVERGFTRGEGWSQPAEADGLRARFADACPALRDVLSVPESWTAWPLAELPVGRLAGPRTALIGDAVHPVLPYMAQGGALALEDAIALACALRKGGDPQAALAGYARSRVSRVRRVQDTARRNGRIFHMGGLPALARNLALGIRPPDIRGLDWLYGWKPPSTRPLLDGSARGR